MNGSLYYYRFKEGKPKALAVSSHNHVHVSGIRNTKAFGIAGKLEYGIRRLRRGSRGCAFLNPDFLQTGWIQTTSAFLSHELRRAVLARNYPSATSQRQV